MNGKANKAANEATLLSKGTLTLNGISQCFEIPYNLGFTCRELFKEFGRKYVDDYCVFKGGRGR